MKKTLIIFVAFTLTIISSYAEKQDLKLVFDNLAEYSKHDFESLKVKELSRKEDKDSKKLTYSSKIEISGSNNTCIEVHIFNKDTFIYYIANYGKYKTIEKATEKLNTIKANLLESHQNFKFMDLKQTYPDFLFTKEISDKVRLYKANLHITKVNDEYEVLFEMKRNKEGYKEYTTIDNEQSNEPICKQIRSVMAEAPNKFKKFQGEDVTGSKSIFATLSKKYLSTLQLVGSKTCYIQQSLADYTFVIEAMTGLSQEDSRKQLQNMFQIMALSMGKGHAYRLIPDKLGVEFVDLKKADFLGEFTNTANLSIEKKDEKFDSYIRIFSTLSDDDSDEWF